MLMRSTPIASPVRDCIAAAAMAALIAGCATKHDLVADSFSANAPFSRTLTGSGDSVCWSVKRTLLSQGYMLDRSNESAVVTGTRDWQPKPKQNVSIRLQASCADNHNGTSIVFVTATREDSRLQRMKQSTTAGIGPATVTFPSGSAEVLGVVSRKTIMDPAFYDRFFSLVEGYVAQDQLSHPEAEHPQVRNQ
jgi:Uncharacterized protein conserved in bacteria (DUF2242)